MRIKKLFCCYSPNEADRYEIDLPMCSTPIYRTSQPTQPPIPTPLFFYLPKVKYFLIKVAVFLIKRGINCLFTILSYLMFILLIIIQFGSLILFILNIIIISIKFEIVS